VHCSDTPYDWRSLLLHKKTVDFVLQDFGEKRLKELKFECSS
jgi:hypothetical protein